MHRGRRTVLRVLGVGGMAALSGCFFSGGTEAGSVVISNRNTSQVTVDVSISRIPRPSDNEPSEVEEDAEYVEPVWVREYEYEVGGGEDYVDTAVISEPGYYHVETMINGNESDSGRLRLYRARNGLAEDYVSISVGEHGRPTISMTHSD